MGLTDPKETMRPGEKDLNDRLQASVEGLDQRLKNFLSAAFGEQADIEGNYVKWKGQPPRDEELRAPGDLLRLRDFTPEQAARVLALEPDSSVTQALRAWAQDAESYQRLVRNPQSDEAQTFRRVLLNMQPYRSDEPLWRGLKFDSVEERDRYLTDWQNTGVVPHQALAVSTSKSREFALTNYTNEYGILLEVRKHSSGRDFEPIARAVGGQPIEQEVLVPGPIDFALLDATRTTRATYSAGQMVEIPYITISEIESP